MMEYVYKFHGKASCTGNGAKNTISTVQSNLCLLTSGILNIGLFLPIFPASIQNLMFKVNFHRVFHVCGVV